MKILCYVYDSVKNPILAGGGIYREVNLHKVLAPRHSIRFYSGAFPGAGAYEEDRIEFRFLGLPRNYLLSRATFALFATIHSLFARADLYVVSFSVYSPVLTFLFKPGRTVIQFYHFTGKNSVAKYGLFGYLPFLAEKLVFRFGRYFITMADSIAREIRERYGKSALATYTGIDEKLRDPAPLPGDYLLSFGRIDVHMKGLDRLFDIFESLAGRHPSLRLVISGRGKKKDMDTVEKKAAQSPHGARITFVKNPTPAQKYDLFRGARLVVIPSRFEGWNIVALEAAAGGKPVVASRIPGLDEAVQDNETGFLCEQDRTDDFAEKILRLWSDPALYGSMSRKAYQWALQFNWDRVASLQEGYYLRAAENAKR